MLTNRKKCIKLLSIDGGGIKGLIPAQILYRIEKELGIVIHDYFDVFSGTSAGSMIIGAIVYNKATGEDIVNKLLPDSRAKKMMKQSIKDKILNVVQVNPKYNGIEKRKIIFENVGVKSLNDTTKYVLIPCFNINHNKTTFFKSWDPIYGNYKVVDIIDASSAAPSYFPGVKINGDYYVDGGISVNNPVDSVYSDILELFPDCDIKILSLGTGKCEINKKHNITYWGGIQWMLIGDITSILMEGPEKMVHYRMEKFCKTLGHEYLRINGNIKNASIDNTSEKNLKLLRQYGDEWFELNKDKLINFFKY